MLADPLDDTTWNNDNTVYNNPIRSTFTHISKEKWEKIFGHKWMQIVWKSSRPRWVVLRPPLRNKI